MEQYLETGKIVTTHGVKGFVKAEPWCDSPRILAQLPCIYIKTIQGFQKIRILHAAIQKNAVLLQLEGCTDLDSALHFKDTVIFADRNCSRRGAPRNGGAGVQGYVKPSIAGATK